jgi:OOP family OmpA-OmpF porin
MKKMSCVLTLLLGWFSYGSAQKSTAADGSWSIQYIVLKNTPEADAMIRVGDIDNLNQGWTEGFTPFSGRTTDPHGYPWDVQQLDAKGTDKIMVPSGYSYEKDDAGKDGYTGSTQRPANNPEAIFMDLRDIKDIPITAASLQLFIDDFQTPEYSKKFQVRLNGKRFLEAEKILKEVNQSGPVGKLITIPLKAEQLSLLSSDSLVIFIDDPVTETGDGYAIDFAKLLINPKGFLYKGNIKGKVIDEGTRMPIANAIAEVPEYGKTTTGKEGNFVLKNMPAGLNVVSASAKGYSAEQKQADVTEGETTEEILIPLKRSGKVKYNEQTMQEGDKLVLKNIQFQVSSAGLLAAGKTELNKLAAFMQKNPEMEIELAGHTSSEGAAATNRELSLQRVTSCKNYLVSKGIDESRISTRGYGPDKPIAPNTTEAGRIKNRRVELWITKL